VDITDEIVLTIDFVAMLQINKKTHGRRAIRLSLESIDQQGFYNYQWLNEKKIWQSYDATAMISIAQAIRNKQTNLSIVCDTRSYNIDLTAMNQTNTSTNVIRKIQCSKSSEFSRESIVDIIR
jgi:hypothetical protein